MILRTIPRYQRVWHSKVEQKQRLINLLFCGLQNFDLAREVDKVLEFVSPNRTKWKVLTDQESDLHRNIPTHDKTWLSTDRQMLESRSEYETCPGEILRCWRCTGYYSIVITMPKKERCSRVMNIDGEFARGNRIITQLIPRQNLHKATEEFELHSQLRCGKLRFNHLPHRPHKGLGLKVSFMCRES